MTSARFDPTGRNVFVGTSAGTVYVLDVRTKGLVARHRISGAGAIKGLEFAKEGRRLATNSSDRTIRQFTLPRYPSPSSSARNGLPSSSTSPPVEDTIARNSNSNGNGSAASETSPVSINAHPILEIKLEPTHKFNDPILKVAWHSVSYSPDGEWLAGGAADPATHKIYIWDIPNDGQFASALDGGQNH